MTCPAMSRGTALPQEGLAAARLSVLADAHEDSQAGSVAPHAASSASSGAGARIAFTPSAGPEGSQSFASGPDDGDPASRDKPKMDVKQDGDDGSTAAPSSPGRPRTIKPDKHLCAFCFRVLWAHLQRLPAPALTGPWLETAESWVPGLFVSWRTSSASLRGCMGSLSPVRLQRGLADYALMSSLQDRRFRPLRSCEMDSLTCEVSILHSFEPCKDVYDWKVGVHGVRVAFAVKSFSPMPAAYEAVFLPEVMVEAGLTHQLAIKKLVLKAGYMEHCDQEFVKRIKATRFQSHTCKLHYSDFSLMT
mmetsp:Transcript_58015/g.182109  ORF Transcript_58015/g.182109 Transcript_58015/m.182109 type:complete len:305 (+) Transcript_58015:1-915(+)